MEKITSWKNSKKNCYQTLFCGDLIEGLAIADGGYDAIISVGTFGPIGPQPIRECLRVVKPGGIALISINEIFMEEQDFAVEIDRIVDEGYATLRERETHPHLTEGGHEAAFLTADPNVHHQLVIAKGRPQDDDFSTVQQLSFRVEDLNDVAINISAGDGTETFECDVEWVKKIAEQQNRGKASRDGLRCFA